MTFKPLILYRYQMLRIPVQRHRIQSVGCAEYHRPGLEPDREGPSDLSPPHHTGWGCTAIGVAVQLLHN
jgi:hypothetical protein